MDGTLLGYMNLNIKEAKNVAKQMIDTVKELHGVLTILWHNNIFSWPYRKDWAEFYEWLLQYATEKEGWLTSSENVYKWVTM
jgi:hypothetical protein